MEKDRIRLKKFHINWRQCVCLGLLLFCLSFSIWRFPYVYPRLFVAVKNLFVSFVYYWTDIFGTPTVDATVNELPSIGQEYVGFTFPFEWRSFWTKCIAFFQLFFNLQTVTETWTVFSEEVLPKLLPLLTLLIWSVFAILLLCLLFLDGRNLKHGRKTKPLKLWESFSTRYLDKLRFQCACWKEFFLTRTYWKKCFQRVWQFNFNLFAVVVDFFAWLFYFCSSFDFLRVYFQVYKLFYDVFDMFLFVPLPIWVFVIFWWLNRRRFNVADRRVRVMEMDDRDFTASCPIVCMICAEPGAGKTTQMVSMGRETQYRFREQSFKILMDCDLKFPNFPWISFEDALKREIRRKTVKNLFTAREFVFSIAQAFEKNPSFLHLYGYDWKHYGLFYDDGLNTKNLFEVLDDYARAYFIFVVKSSLIFANFSVGSDDIFIDGGNFPKWNMDYFSRDPIYRNVYRKFAHILDFDFIRFGLTVADNPEYSNMFEFGIILVTEIGKERGNTLENQEMKKTAEEANAKNDLLNDYIKMCRHLATICGFPFVVFYTDEQRPETWGADARDLARLIRIERQEKSRLAIPCFHLEESILQWMSDWEREKYSDYRWRRGDKGLLMHFIHHVGAWAKRFLNRLYGRYGYRKQIITIEKGSLDGQREERVYWLPHKITYDDAFTTDCFSEIFAHRVSMAEVGIEDVPTFRTKIASIMEMSKMNSYFFKKLTDRFVA